MKRDQSTANTLCIIKRLWIITLMVVALASCRPPPPFFYDFESEASLDRLKWKCKTIFSLSDEHATSGSRSLQVDFYPEPNNEQENYPGLSITGFDRNWSKHQQLVLDIHNPESLPIPLTLRLDDYDNPLAKDRLNRKIILAPGPNHLTIPLKEMITSGTGRLLELGQINTIFFFLAAPKQPLTLYFDNIHLE